MQSVIETIDPAAPTIYVRRGLTSVSNEALSALRVVTTPAGRESDCLRVWLRGAVDAEIARRYSEDGELEEPAILNLPWHHWNDDQLRNALSASWSWIDITIPAEPYAILMEVHRACVAACCTRLGELHEAIQRARSGK